MDEMWGAAREAGTGGPGPTFAGTEDAQPNPQRMCEKILTVEISAFFMSGSLNGTTCMFFSFVIVIDALLPRAVVSSAQVTASKMRPAKVLKVQKVQKVQKL